MRFICTNCGKRRKLRSHKFSSGHTRCRSCRGLVKLDVFGSMGIAAAQAAKAFRRMAEATLYCGQAITEGARVLSTFDGNAVPEPTLTEELLRKAIDAVGPPPEPVAFLVGPAASFELRTKFEEPHPGTFPSLGVQLFESNWVRPGIAYKGHPDKIRKLVEMLECATSQEIADKIIALFEHKEQVQ